MSNYRTFDQREKLGEPPWSGPALKVWEEAHGHDARLKCYPEFGCQVLEEEREAELERLRRIETAARDYRFAHPCEAPEFCEAYAALKAALEER